MIFIAVVPTHKIKENSSINEKRNGFLNKKPNLRFSFTFSPQNNKYIRHIP